MFRNREGRAGKGLPRRPEVCDTPSVVEDEGWPRGDEERRQARPQVEDARLRRRASRSAPRLRLGERAGRRRRRRGAGADRPAGRSPPGRAPARPRSSRPCRGRHTSVDGLTCPWTARPRSAFWSNGPCWVPLIAAWNVTACGSGGGAPEPLRGRGVARRAVARGPVGWCITPGIIMPMPSPRPAPMTWPEAPPGCCAAERSASAAAICM